MGGGEWGRGAGWQRRCLSERLSGVRSNSFVDDRKLTSVFPFLSRFGSPPHSRFGSPPHAVLTQPLAPLRPAQTSQSVSQCSAPLSLSCAWVLDETYKTNDVLLELFGIAKNLSLSETYTFFCIQPPRTREINKYSRQALPAPHPPLVAWTVVGLGQQPDGQTPPRSEGVHHTAHTHYLGTARLLGISGELGRVRVCVCVCVAHPWASVRLFLPISLRSLSPILAATFMPPRGRPTLVVLSLVTSSSVASLLCPFCQCRAWGLKLPR